jgi:hypothetical protein
MLKVLQILSKFINYHNAPHQRRDCKLRPLHALVRQDRYIVEGVNHFLRPERSDRLG